MRLNRHAYLKADPTYVVNAKSCLGFEFSSLDVMTAPHPPHTLVKLLRFNAVVKAGSCNKKPFFTFSVQQISFETKLAGPRWA